MKLSKNSLSPMGQGSIQRIYLKKETRDEDNFSKATINHEDEALGKNDQLSPCSMLAILLVLRVYTLLHPKHSWLAAVLMLSITSR